MTRAPLLMLAAAALAGAHPMGNFSVSHYARFDVRAHGIELTYILDLAEIPTFELLRDWNLDGRDRAAAIARAEREAPRWLAGLRLEPAGAKFRKARAEIQDGAGGLPVLRVEVSAALEGGSGAIRYRDTNYEGRAGWKEIVVVPHEGTELRSGAHSAVERSRQLRQYPEDPSVAPPEETAASFSWSAPRPPEAAKKSRRPAPAYATTPPLQSRDREGAVERSIDSTPGAVVRGDYLSRMLAGGEIGFAAIFAGLCVAFGLGATHALSPGHGKTIVAAYLVGSRGTFRHALLLGVTVTFTHTASVFALGLAVLLAQQYVLPERIVPVLGAVSGLSIVLVAASLLRKRIRALRHVHHHHHDHHHHHHVPEKITPGSLIALGVGGGLVPCPSALVLLLSAVALGRVALGLALLAAFSLGLASVLTGIGALVLYARNLLPERSRLASGALRYVPVVSAAVVMVLGIAITGMSLGWRVGN